MSLILQNRDVIVLRELGACGFLSLEQVARFAFTANSETARKRIRKLAKAGIVEIQKVPNSNLRIIRLTSRTILALRKVGLPAQRLGKPTKNPCLQHDLMVRDVQIAFELATQARKDVMNATFDLDRRSLRFRCLGFTLFPDALIKFSLEDNSMSEVFLEVDRGTETHERLLAKLNLYKRLFFRKECDRSQRSFVLFLFQSRVRAASFMLRISQIGASHWATALPQDTLVENIEGVFSFCEKVGKHLTTVMGKPTEMAVGSAQFLRDAISAI